MRQIAKTSYEDEFDWDEDTYESDGDDRTQADPLQSFLDDGLITEVIRPVKSGKEGTVYCCRAAPSVGADLVAAKIYRSRKQRVFRNDAVYQEGRVMGKHREARAVKNKTRVGRELQHALWLGHEFEALKALRAFGADVPRPIARSESAILLEYFGDEELAAPMLTHVTMQPEEVRPLLDCLLQNIELWLARDYIHGDLSPYNILYWKGKIVIIDFPQAIDPRFNPNAFSLLQRDLVNICTYWDRYGVKTDPYRMAEFLWDRFLRAEL
jgi:RIO kinase 1